jgi:hypothetical protein
VCCVLCGGEKGKGKQSIREQGDNDESCRLAAMDKTWRYFTVRDDMREGWAECWRVVEAARRLEPHATT